MTIKVGVGGAHRTVAAIWVGVGGVWRAVTRADVGVGGAWRNGFSAITLADTYSVSDFASDPSNAIAEFQLNSDGRIYENTGPGMVATGQWTVPGTDASLYEVVAAQTSSSGNTTGSFGTLNLETSRTWGATRNSVGVSTQTVTLAIRLVGTSTALDSTTLTVTAEKEI